MIERVLSEETEAASKSIHDRWKLKAMVNGAMVFSFDQYKVVFSVEKHKTSKWKHASITLTHSQLPSWGDIRLMKQDFFGPEAYAIQVLPPDTMYVNEHNYCMHLWQYLDGENWPIEGG